MSADGPATCEIASSHSSCGTNDAGALFPSSQRRGGCGSNKKSRSHSKRRRRGGQSDEMLGPENFAELTTPSAPFRNGTILLMARPPLLCEEGNTLDSNSFT